MRGPSDPPSPSTGLFRIVAPATFVVAWASGFVVARLVVAHAEPMTFLAARFGLASVLMTIAALWLRAPWPRSLRAWRDMVGIGLLTQAISLGSVFWAVSRGLPSGVAALIAATQPLLTAMLVGPLLGERVSARRLLGVVIGLAGVALVLAPKLTGTGAYPPVALAVVGAGIASMTLGTLWQKSVGATSDLRTAVPIQFGGSAILALLIAVATETGRIDPAPALWFGLAWAVGVLSIGSVSLLYSMLRRGGVVGVASYMFLVPPVASLMALALFGETLTAVQWGGMAIAALGVALTVRPD